MSVKNGLAAKRQRRVARATTEIAEPPPPAESDAIFLDPEDCALAATMVMQNEKFQLHVGGLLKGMGKDRSVPRHLVILAAAIVPDEARPGLDPAIPVQTSGES